MNDKDYQIMKVLGDTGNITHAAEVLFMTQSAISKRLKQIEFEFGQPLLIRSHQGITFTPAGEEVLAFCRKTLSDLDQIKQSITATTEDICGTLRVGYSISYGTYRLARQISEYHNKYPNVNLKVTSDQSPNLYQQMMEGTLDLAIIRGEHPWEGIRHKIACEHVYLVCSQENKDKPLSEYMYISRKTDALLVGQMAKWLREENLASNASYISVDNITTCCELVEAGTGWAILPEIALENFNGVKRELYFRNGDPFIRNTYLICQSGAAQLPQVEKFIEMITEGESLKNAD